VAGVSADSRFRALASTTPGRYRLWSVGVAAALVVVATAGTVAATGLDRSHARIRDNTGPVLVATQQLVASLAEADAAATAAFLSGRDEDREQRRLYEQALARASQQLEDVAARIGDDPATHESLTAIAVQVTRYAGLVEAARAVQRADAPGGEDYLVDALTLLGTTVAEDTRRLTAATQERFRADEAGRDTGVAVAVGLGVAALAGLVAVQVALTRRTRRLVNLPLALATLALAGATGWLAWANIRSGGDLATARRDGYDSIALTAQIQSSGFRAKSEETVALITGDQARRQAAQAEAGTLLDVAVTEPLVATVRNGNPVAARGLLAQAAARADSPRERAAVAELFVRWQRYLDTVAALRAAPTPEQGREVAVGPASSTFNGFNFSVESVLGDNRTQFLDGLVQAADRVGALPAVTLLAPLVAAVAALGGLQLRINEYR
jgi:CHASE3 domain sensor protein